MEKSNLSIETYTISHNDKEYILYLIPEDHNSIGIYMQRKQCGIISLCIGVVVEQLSCGMEDFIDECIDEWVEDYESEIEDLENAHLQKEG